MKLVLTTPLPQGWERETDPEGNVVYHYKGNYNSNPQSQINYLNISNDELTPIHPLESFFRKTFANVVKHQMDDNYSDTIKKIVVDQLSSIKIGEVMNKAQAEQK